MKIRYQVGLAALLPTLLAGCSGGPGFAEQTPSPTVDVDAYPDLAEWQPTTKISPREFTPEEAAQIQLAAIEDDRPEGAEQLEIPPVVAVLEGRDRDEALAKCLTDAGFPSVPSVQGGVTGEAVPDSQLSLLQTAYWVCHAQYPLPSGYYVDYSSDQLGVIYEYWTEFYLPCAAAHGIEVDTAQVPSRETFVSAWLQGEQWRPEALVYEIDIGRLTSPDTVEGVRFFEKCPVNPPYQYLFG